MLLLLVLSPWIAPSRADEEASADRSVPKPTIEELGGDLYRVGEIQVDKGRARFTVPGVILRDEPPLEFLAVTRGGYKGYESLIELGTSAHQFNLACILIGLDSGIAKPPRLHFDPEPVQGDPVRLGVEWVADGESVRVDASDLVLMRDAGGDESRAESGEKAREVTLPRGEWVYTGSLVMPDGRYLAELDGTVIGFVHDPSSIIEHRTGFGLGRYGDVLANRKLLPARGTAITLIVERSGKP